MKKELKIFLSAIIYFTRIPVGRLFTEGETPDNGKNIKYFTLIGWLVGIPGALVAFVLILIDPSLKFLAVLLGLLTIISLTGALHEDGLADFLDGFGGGWTKETILEIMKDSRIGTFGTIGLIGIISAKLLTVSELDPNMIPLVIISGQTISRTSIYLLTETLNYSTLNTKSKTVSIFNKKLNLPELFFAVLIGLMPLLLSWSLGILILMSGQIFITVLFRKYIKKWLNGFTGDCLGACQQMNEALFYFQVLILSKLELLTCRYTLLDILNQM